MSTPHGTVDGNQRTSSHHAPAGYTGDDDVGMTQSDNTAGTHFTDEEEGTTPSDHTRSNTHQPQHNRDGAGASSQHHSPLLDIEPDVFSDDAGMAALDDSHPPVTPLSKPKGIPPIVQRRITTSIRQGWPSSPTKQGTQLSAHSYLHLMFHPARAISLPRLRRLLWRGESHSIRRRPKQAGGVQFKPEAPHAKWRHPRQTKSIQSQQKVSRVNGRCPKQTERAQSEQNASKANRRRQR